MSHYPRKYHRKLTALAFALHMLMGSAYAAESVQTTTELAIRIPAQSLGQALNALAAKTGWFIGADAALVRGKQAPALDGNYSLEAALRALLDGSGLQYRITQDRTAIIERSAPTATTVPVSPSARQSAPSQQSEAEVLALGEIIVTGEKFERKLEDTLSSVVVATSEDMREHGDQTLEDVMMRTPGVYMQSGSENWGIRGVPASGFDDQGPVTINGAVAVYVDGTLQPHRVVTMNPLPLWDAEQIEVFRGAQSTVQGRNALAGAVIVQTRDPSYKPELSAQINAGNYGQSGMSVLAGGALVEGVAAGRVALDYQETDGYIDNKTLDKDAYGQRNFNMRGKLLLQPHEQLDILLTAARSEHVRGENAVAAVNGRPQYYKIFYDTDARSSIDQNATSAKIDYYLNDAWTLTSLTTGSWSDYDSLLDFDQTAATNQEVARDHQQQMLSQELKLGYEAEKLRGHVGLYLSRLDVDTHDLLNFSGTNILDARGDTKINNQALFGELNWDFAPQWQLIAGMRYDHEKNDTEIRYPVDGFGLASAPSTEQSKTFNAFLPKLGLSYRLAPDHLIGFVAQRGYRAGGVHLRPAAAHETYDAEFTDNYELSYRGAWLDKRLRGRANLYYTDWKDQQVRTLDNNGFLSVANAARSELQGLEIAMEYDLTSALSLSAGAAYNDTEYKDFESADGDLSGRAFLYAPKQKLNIGATYRYGTQFTANVDVTYQSGSPSGYETDGSGNVINTRRSDSVTLVNTTLGYRINKTLSLNAYIKNLFDEKYIVNNQGDDLLDVGAPRTLGVALRADI